NPVEDVFQHLELEATTIALRHDGDAGFVYVARDVGDGAGEAGGRRFLAQSVEETFLGAADGLQLGVLLSEQRIGYVDELFQVHALGDPVVGTHDHCAARQVDRNAPLGYASTAIPRRQHAHGLVA